MTVSDSLLVRVFISSSLSFKDNPKTSFLPDNEEVLKIDPEVGRVCTGTDTPLGANGSDPQESSKPKGSFFSLGGIFLDPYHEVPPEGLLTVAGALIDGVSNDSNRLTSCGLCTSVRIERVLDDANGAEDDPPVVAARTPPPGPVDAKGAEKFWGFDEANGVAVS
jgi:hypothetical protein